MIRTREEWLEILSEEITMERLPKFVYFGLHYPDEYSEKELIEIFLKHKKEQEYIEPCSFDKEILLKAIQQQPENLYENPDNALFSCGYSLTFLEEYLHGKGKHLSLMGYLSVTDRIHDEIKKWCDFDKHRANSFYHEVVEFHGWVYDPTIKQLDYNAQNPFICTRKELEYNWIYVGLAKDIEDAIL